MIAITDAIHAHGPMTSKQIANHVDASSTSISLHLKRLKDRKLIYISGYVVRLGAHGRDAPIYAMGNLPHAAVPKKVIKVKRQQTRPPTPSKIDLVRSANQAAGMWGGLMT